MFTLRQRDNHHAVVTLPCRYQCAALCESYPKGKYADALAIIREKVPFPAVLGRVCTAPCEEACTGCAMCVVYCPMNAIIVNGKGQKEVKIDQDECAD